MTVLFKDPSKTLFVLKPPTGFNGTFLRSHVVLVHVVQMLYLDFVPGEFKKVSSPDRLTQVSVVLSGSCSQQYESRRGDAVLFADKEVVDFLEPRCV